MQLAVMIIQSRPSVTIDHSYANSEDPYLETESEIVPAKAILFFQRSTHNVLTSVARKYSYKYKRV